MISSDSFRFKVEFDALNFVLNSQNASGSATNGTGCERRPRIGPGGHERHGGHGGIRGRSGRGGKRGVGRGGGGGDVLVTKYERLEVDALTGAESGQQRHQQH